MTSNPQWHDFPYKDGVYAIKDDGFISIVRICEFSGIDQNMWYFRSEGSALIWDWKILKSEEKRGHSKIEKYEEIK